MYGLVREFEAEHARRRSTPERRFERVALCVRIQAFVEERPACLVAGEQTVKPLMAELVYGHGLERARPESNVPRATRGDERGILHAAGRAGVFRGMYDRQRPVRVVPVARFEV